MTHFAVTECLESGSDLGLGGNRVGENRLADADSWKPARAFGGQKTFEAGFIVSDGVKKLPALEVNERIIITSREEVMSGQFGVVGIEQDIATKLIRLGDFKDPVGIALNANVDVFISTDKGVDS